MNRVLVLGGLLAGVLLSAPASAQTGIARGKVTDAQGEALADVKIHFEFLGGVKKTHDVKTNKKGEFTQVGVYPGMYKITFEKEGFQGTFLEWKINLGEPTQRPDVKLQSAAAAAGGAAAAGARDVAAALQKSFAQAIELTNAGKLDEAAAIYTAEIAKNPSIPQLHHNLGLIHQRKGDYAAAEASLRAAIAAREDYVEAYVALSNMFLAAGDAGKGLEEAQALAAKFPESPRGHFQIGNVLFNTGRAAEAVEPLKKAEALGETDPELLFQLGSATFQASKMDEAIAYFEKYLAAPEPKNPGNVAAAQGLSAAIKAMKK
jgi:tetratricopeptide (TPR) repeat protein